MVTDSLPIFADNKSDPSYDPKSTIFQLLSSWNRWGWGWGWGCEGEKEKCWTPYCPHFFLHALTYLSSSPSPSSHPHTHPPSPSTITEPPLCLTIGTVHLGSNSSSRLLHNIILPSDPKKVELWFFRPNNSIPKAQRLSYTFKTIGVIHVWFLPSNPVE